MGALFEKERHGTGQRVDCSQLGAMITLQTLAITNQLIYGKQPDDGNYGDVTQDSSPFMSTFKAADGKLVTISYLGESQFKKLMGVLEYACMPHPAPQLRLDCHGWHMNMTGCLWLYCSLSELIGHELTSTHSRRIRNREFFA